MRKYCFALLAAAAVMVGCSKEDIPSESAGIPMTINVSIGDAATKTTYTPDGGALKVEWEAGDQISVVSIGSDNIAKTCDTFTTTEGGSSASFSGTYTGAEDAEIIKVFYPALTTTGTISDVTGWATASVSGQFTSTPRFVISNSNIYCRNNFAYANQSEDDDPSHLKYYDSMSANLASIDDLADVTLAKHSSVIKLIINTSNIPDGTLMKTAMIKNTIGSKSVFRVADWGWAYQDLDFARNAATHPNAIIYLGDNTVGSGSSLSVTGITKTAGDNTLVVYIPIMAGATMTAGDSYEISVGTGEAGTNYYTKTVTLPSNIVIPMGSCYTLSATVSE